MVRAWKMNDTKSKRDETQMPHFTKAEVVEVARMQKAVLWLLLALLVANGLAASVPIIGLVVYLVVVVASLIYTYKLAKAVKALSPGQYLVLGLIPCLNLIALLMINSNATAVLKAHGIAVGLMGANQKQLTEFSARQDIAEY